MSTKENARARRDPSLAVYLALLRNRRELTQQELAERSGLSPDTIRRLEGTKGFSPSLDTMTKLCVGLDIGMSTFCQGLELGALAQPASELIDLIAAQPAAVQTMARAVLRELFTLLDGGAS